jgi:hypothetical protein
MKNSRAPRTLAAACAAFPLLAGCASAPVDPLVESLDERTAVTVVALSEPLLFTSTRSTPSLPDDVALGPVEINRMGEKTWYLWVNRLGGPQESATLARLRIVAQGATLLELEPLASDVRLPVSGPPYRPLAEWAAQAYYPISADEAAESRGSDRAGDANCSHRRDGHAAGSASRLYGCHICA